MLRGDEQWLSAVDAFQAAALDGHGWLAALSQLADGTGSRVGELIGLGSANSVPFNWVTDLGPDWAEDFVACGGGDPNVNPFVRAGIAVPPLQVLSSEEFITEQERRTSVYLNEHAPRWDLTAICLTPLLRQDDMLVGLAVIRSSSQGEITHEQRAVFASLAPHVRTAVRTQLALEHQGALLLAGAMEALSLAVFVCDRGGAVRAMTPAAEELVSAGEALCLRQGNLRARRRAESGALSQAIGVAAHGLNRPGLPLASTVLVQGSLVQPLVLDVLPLPRREFAFGFEPRAVVVVRGVTRSPRYTRDLLQTAYRLTGAEADVALRLADGEPVEAIAAARGASVGTVRVQIRTVFTKLDVHRQSELIARVNHLR